MNGKLKEVTYNLIWENKDINKKRENDNGGEIFLWMKKAKGNQLTLKSCV